MKRSVRQVQQMAVLQKFLSSNLSIKLHLSSTLLEAPQLQGPALNDYLQDDVVTCSVCLLYVHSTFRIIGVSSLFQRFAGWMVCWFDDLQVRWSADPTIRWSDGTLTGG